MPGTSEEPAQNSAAPSPEVTQASPSGRKILRAIAIAGCVLLLAALALAADWMIALPKGSIAAATYVGTQKCASCHQVQHASWHGSHHDRAMELATDEAVLGDFNDAKFERLGVVSTFFKRGDKFFVNTEGPEGENEDFEIKYTFGVEPLQQYMIEFPDGRVQVLRVSWDTNKEEWFYVPPPDAPDERLAADDPLHWTGTAQNWNHTCAACHSTNLQKNYDLATDHYATTFSDIDVGCEACHGPGSTHVQLAESPSPFWDRNVKYGLVRLKGADPTNQLNTCFPCHSRRATIHADFRPGDNFLDAHDPAMILPGLYHDDGQILDEVYVYGSFLQSRMHAEGVRCTDCHDPHSLKLKFEGNNLCGQCHTPGKYDTELHHHHPTGTEGAACVNCHMIERDYMVVDPRRDHSFRIPRPDLTVELGTPNACNDCHTKEKETPEWAAEAVRRWFGDERPGEPHHARAIHASQEHDSDADKLLRDLAARRQARPILRATAVALLGAYPNRASEYIRSRSLTDKEPLIRLAAVRAFTANDPRVALDRLLPVLDDKIRSVRIAAARRLAELPPAVLDGLNEEQRLRFDEVLEEYKDAHRLALDRAASHLALGELEEQLGDLRTAKEHYEAAIKVEPYLSGGRSRLAAMLEQQIQQLSARGNQQAAEELAAQVRRLREEEADLLARDVKLLPTDGTLRYRYGLLLYLLGQNEEAVEQLRKAAEFNPDSYDYHLALVLLLEKQGALQEALDSLGALQRLRPGDPSVSAIGQRIQQALGGSN